MNTDLISRQAAIDAFSMFAEYESNRTNAEWVDRIRVVLSSLPSVTPKQRTGHWIKDSPFTKPYCSECETSCFGLHGFDYMTSPYCPNCGAKMVEPQESEDKE